MDNPTLNTISLCSGVGMLDEGVHAGLEFMGIRSRTCVYAEREAYPVSVLAARMEEGSLDAAPIWFGDFTELQARRFRGLVDGIVAGFPCQDLSVAGRRAGLNGKRSGLFFNVLDIADESGAWFLVLENVAGIASATASVVDEASTSDYATKPDGSGFSDVGIEDGMLLERAAARVMGELADRGWNAEWITLSASDVGASHGRARWFCFAWRRELDDSDRFGAQRARREESSADSGCEELADPERSRWSQAGSRFVIDAGGESESGCGDVANAGRSRFPERVSRGGLCERTSESNQRADLELHGYSLFAPGPTDQRWPGLLARFPWLAPAIGDKEAESLLCGEFNGLEIGLDFSYRAARLRACGNGVVPSQAAAALVVLVRRSGLFGE